MTNARIAHLRTVDDARAFLESQPRHVTTPFADETVAFLETLSRSLLADPRAKAHPEVIALGFFLRHAEVSRLESYFTQTPEARRAAVGTVLHFPPANVDTMFVVSLFWSLLSGNCNWIRLSSRETPAGQLLEHCVLHALDNHPSVRARVGLFRSPRDSAITQILCEATDMRVIWGGDASVRQIREVPMSPRARELVFANRESFALLNASAVHGCDDATFQNLVHASFNDMYWFDQAACSSPRAFVWLGTSAVVQQARQRLYPALSAYAEKRGIDFADGALLAKRLFAMRAAADGRVTCIDEPSHRLTIAQVTSLLPSKTDAHVETPTHPGSGFVLDAAIASIGELSHVLSRVHQTITVFGLEPSECERLLEVCRTHGVDRVVPVGQALATHRYWDGHDLLHAFSRIVHFAR